jgi:hypothetical protein
MKFSHALCTLALRDDNGILRFGVDWLGSPSEPGGGDPAESIQPFGFRALPRDPDLDPEGRIIAGRGAGLLLADDGGETFAWPTQDPRYRTVLPAIAAGSSELYAAHADLTCTRVTVAGDTGDVTVTTKTGATVKVLSTGVLEAGAVNALDPGAAPSAVAVAAPLATWAAAASTFASAVSVFTTAVGAHPLLTAALATPAATLAAAATAFQAACSAVQGTYPAGMTATRITTR